MLNWFADIRNWFFAYTEGHSGGPPEVIQKVGLDLLAPCRLEAHRRCRRGSLRIFEDFTDDCFNPTHRTGVADHEAVRQPGGYRTKSCVKRALSVHFQCSSRA